MRRLSGGRTCHLDGWFLRTRRSQVFAAGIIRGATGFGFSMLALVLLTFVLPPAQVVPLLLLWEIFASAGHAPFVWRQCDWKVTGLLLLGVVPLTPVAWLCSSTCRRRP